MTGSSFGIDESGNPTHAAVPDKGLPYSGVGRNLEMGGNYPSMTVPTVTIQRTVSRFRLVLSQLADAVGPVVQFTIKELSIDGDLLPLEESVFNDSDQPYKISGGYLSQKVQFPIPSSIASNLHPQNYAGREGQSAQSFEAQILEGVQSGELTQLGPYYFRETNQPLSGSISYSIMGGEDKVKTFSMSSAGFTRNHSWTVYLYFLSTEMDFQVSWTPWEQGQDFYVK